MDPHQSGAMPRPQSPVDPALAAALPTISATATSTASTGAAMTATPPFDPARYWAYLDGLEASDAQKAALLEALWSIMAGFVQLGFGVDPVQTLIPALVRASLDDEGDADSSAIPRKRFNAAAKDKQAEEDRP